MFDRLSNTCILPVVHAWENRYFQPSITATNAESTGTYTGSIDTASLGDTITYEYIVTNDGTTTMSGLILEDTAVGFSFQKLT